MYTVILDEGIVIRDLDGLVVAPCQSVQDVDFLIYEVWIAEGNTPTILETRG